MTGNRSATQMVDTLVEHRLNCAPSLFRCFSLTHETKYKTNVTLHKKLCWFKTFNNIRYYCLLYRTT